MYFYQGNHWLHRRTKFAGVDNCYKKWKDKELVGCLPDENPV
jgi:hypothetical protein